METLAGPKSFNDGEAPSSCQETVACFPPLKVVEATGLVIYRALLGSVM
jgi:hypothetical protein